MEKKKIRELQGEKDNIKNKIIIIDEWDTKILN